MNINNTECVAEKKAHVKKRYKSPSMNCYGAVRELTQAGGSFANENNSAAGCADNTRRTNVNCTS